MRLAGATRMLLTDLKKRGRSRRKPSMSARYAATLYGYDGMYSDEFAAHCS